MRKPTNQPQYVDIMDIAVEDHSIEVRGKRVRLYKLTPRKMAALAKRFPSIKAMQDLNLNAAAGEAEQSIDIEDIEIIAAMVACALGHTNDEAYEIWIDENLSTDEMSEIIQRSQELSMPVENEGFSSRSG